MGGGDLNTKKSWHPSTLKNQERVWKAEQAEAEEKKRILELQREREHENDRTQLNEMVQRNFGAGGSHQAGDNRLHWMYDKPDKQVQHEDYLLGKEIGKSDESERAQNAIPAVSRRVVGSSMTKTLDDTQVDLARKLREDPLLLVKDRERAARAALLNNPLQRKRLTELLRKEKKKDKNLDDMLAAKLNALGGEKGIDLSRLLNSNDSSSESSQSSDHKSKKTKKKIKKEKLKKKTKKSKKKKHSSDSDTGDDNDTRRHEVSAADRYNSIPQHQSYNRNSESTRYDDRRRTDKFYENDHKSYRNREADEGHYREKRERSYDNSKHQSSTSRSYKDKGSESRKRRSDSYSGSDGGETTMKRSKREVDKNRNDSGVRHKRRDSPDKSNQKFMSKKWEGARERKPGMSEAERAAKLLEMSAAGRAREAERGSRLRSNRHYIQRDNTHMNQHFARCTSPDGDDAAAEASSRAPRALRPEARALPDSLESRLRSNRHYIQRDNTHMNQHFARSK
ncbi:Coiled-coil domain-containing protein 49 [Operophtera brumata]|uniref:Coiled-coil domain-containing protein 49 n=1 Tax=Operophtera brumata TaxID=104452 RepID=A0A0L7LHX3_OPEBR|nr:Coiled-coil domain-containing protein 49 [Operophtera brumata]